MPVVGLSWAWVLAKVGWSTLKPGPVLEKRVQGLDHPQAQSKSVKYCLFPLAQMAIVPTLFHPPGHKVLCSHKAMSMAGHSLWVPKPYLVFQMIFTQGRDHHGSH